MAKSKFLFLIISLGLLLRIPMLNGSLWLDEAAQALESARPFSEQFKIAADFQPPLFHYLLHFWMIIGRSEWWMRLISVFAGLGTIALTYLIVRRLYDNRVAITASLLLATSPLHIFFSQELRPYSLAAFWAVLAWYALLNMRNKTKWVIFVLASMAGLYTMYVYAFALIGQCLFVVLENKKNFKPLSKSLIIIALAGSVWLPFFREQLIVGGALKSDLPGWSEVVGYPFLKSLPLTIAKFFMGQVEIQSNPIRMLLILVPISIFLIASYKMLRYSKNRFLIYWFWLPLLLVWIASLFIPILQPKRVLFLLPGLWMIIAIYINSLKRNFAVFLLPLFLALNFSFTCIAWKTNEYQREDWRGLIAVLEQNYSGSDTKALFVFPESFAPWRWYSKGKIESVAIGEIYLDANTKLDLDRVKRYLLFDYLRSLTDPSEVVVKYLTDNGYREERTWDGGEVGFVRSFLNPYNR